MLIFASHFQSINVYEVCFSKLCEYLLHPRWREHELEQVFIDSSFFTVKDVRGEYLLIGVSPLAKLVLWNVRTECKTHKRFVNRTTINQQQQRKNTVFLTMKQTFFFCAYKLPPPPQTPKEKKPRCKRKNIHVCSY
jgi:hypothetical protein